MKDELVVKSAVVPEELALMNAECVVGSCQSDGCNDDMGCYGDGDCSMDC